MTRTVEDAIGLLGLRMKDLVTGATGVVTSVTFDLYGCIQALLNPGLDDDGNPRDSNWYDVNRLTVADPRPVMDRPAFLSANRGPADKPIPRKP